MKLCPKCKIRERAVYGGKIATYCKVCQNECQKRWQKKNPYAILKSKKTRQQKIRDLITEAKSNPCIDCGKSYPWYVMDFDHVRGEKKFDISKSSSRGKGLGAVQEEINKCDLVCSNCHRERTFTRNQWFHKDENGIQRVIINKTYEARGSPQLVL